MKINKLVIMLASLSLLSTGCSKIEHAMETADEIKVSATNLEQESTNSLRKQKESGAIAAMGIAIENLIEAETSTGRLSHATRYFAAMPFQFIYKDEARTHYYYKVSLADFLSERFAELSEGRQESHEVRVRAANGTFITERVWGDAEHQDITEDYNPSHFPELAALAVRMHYITDDQKEIMDADATKSFMALLGELLSASHELETCADCTLDDYPDYIRSNLQFSGQLVDFLQFAHNTLSIAGLKGVVRDATQEERSGQRSYYIYDWLNQNLGTNFDNEPAITHNSLIKDDNNTQDMHLSMERIERARIIRAWLLNAGIQPIYSKYVFEEKYGKYLEQPEGSVNRSRLSSLETQEAFEQFMTMVQSEYDNYVESQE